jgi:hypothetical protein
MGSSQEHTKTAKLESFLKSLGARADVRVNNHKNPFWSRERSLILIASYNLEALAAAA